MTELDQKAHIDAAFEWMMAMSNEEFEQCMKEAAKTDIAMILHELSVEDEEDAGKAYYLLVRLRTECTPLF